MSDVVERYTKLADEFGKRVDATPDDAWTKASPCEGWAARDVVEHVVGGQRHIVARIEGRDDGPAEIPADADPKQVWRDSYAALKQALADPESLQKTVPMGPMGDMPIEFAVGRVFASDILIHTWDLARAVGGDERLDQDAVEQSYKGLQPMDEMIRQNGVFGPKVEPPAGADLQTEFLCFVGRKP